MSFSMSFHHLLGLLAAGQFRLGNWGAVQHHKGRPRRKRSTALPEDNQWHPEIWKEYVSHHIPSVSMIKMLKQIFEVPRETPLTNTNQHISPQTVAGCHCAILRVGACVATAAARWAMLKVTNCSDWCPVKFYENPGAAWRESEASDLLILVV